MGRDGILYVSIFQKKKDRLFDSECVNAFRHAFTKGILYVFK